jgi:Tol biopolymer transport system component
VILMGFLTLLFTRSGGEPVTTTLAESHAEEGWIAFAGAGPYASIDLYLVGLGEPAFRVAFDSIDTMCPAFAPDGTQLAYGEANGALVVADVGVDGTLFETLRVESWSSLIPPCPIWSPDGEMIAAGVREADGGRTLIHTPTTPGDIWIVPTSDRPSTVLENRPSTVLENMYAAQDPEPSNLWSDMEWSPDGTELAITQKRGIMLYSLADDQWRILDGTGLARHLTWSPDGTQIAYEVGRTSLGAQLRVTEVDGSSGRVLASVYDSLSGIGPVWSPTSDQIVYQRDCYPSNGEECASEHEVVLVKPNGDEAVLPDLRLPGDDRIWWPFRVTWSPNGNHLLYLAHQHHPDELEESSAPPALIARPIDLASPAVMLYQGPMEPHGEGGQLAFQSWGRPARVTSN